MDLAKLALLDALRQGAAPGEHRLYQSGKLPGLFAGRTRLNAMIAEQALRDELLEMARIETKGKLAIEWVRVTPRGVEYLVRHESPVRALEELRAALAVNTDGIPAWVAELRKGLEQLQRHVADEVETMGQRLDALSRRVLETIARLEQAHGVTPAEPVSWGQEALRHLEGRTAAGLGAVCTLADLFAALKERQIELNVRDFHTGLRDLRDRALIELLPHDGAEAAPGPEYALVDTAAVYYHVRSSGTRTA